MKSPRPITAVDRMLAYADRVDGTAEPRRRTHRRFGQLDVVVVERDGAPTVVYLTNDEGVIVEATAAELLQAASAVRLVLETPPAKRNKR